MDFLFLGTSSGMPTKQRNVSGLAVIPEGQQGWCLVDCGEGTQHQILHTPLTLHTLSAICITHVHGDHCYGLLGLLASAGMSGRKQPLTLIAPHAIKTWLDTSYQLTDTYLPYDIHFLAVEEHSTWHLENIRIDVTPLSHRVPSYAYSFCETVREARLDSAKLLALGIAQGPIWGKLKAGLDVEWAGQQLRSQDYLTYPYPARKIVVGGDNDQPALLNAACADAQVLIHEATYTQDISLKVGARVQHSCAEMVAAFAQQRQLPHLVLTHFSNRYQHDVNKSPSINDIRLEAAQHYQGQLWLAEDFARYRLSKTGDLTLLNTL